MFASSLVFARLHEPLLAVSQEITSFRFAHDLSQFEQVDDDEEQEDFGGGLSNHTLAAQTTPTSLFGRGASAADHDIEMG